MFLFITAGATTELCAWEEGWDPWKNPVLQHMVRLFSKFPGWDPYRNPIR